MFPTLKALLFGAVICLGLIGTATTASAEQVVFEQLPRIADTDIHHSAPGGSLVTVEISQDKIITAAAQRVNLPAANEVIFVVRRLDSGTWTTIVSTPPQAQADQDYGYIRSPDFAPVTLEAGKTYAIGMLIKNAPFSYELGAYLPAAPVDGVKVTSRLVYHDYAGTTVENTSAFAYSLKLFGPDPAAPVPTMSQWSLILMGLMMAAGAAVWLQRRQTA